mgnify:FL=1
MPQLIVVGMTEAHACRVASRMVGEPRCPHRVGLVWRDGVPPRSLATCLHGTHRPVVIYLHGTAPTMPELTLLDEVSATVLRED